MGYRGEVETRHALSFVYSNIPYSIEPDHRQERSCAGKQHDLSCRVDGPKSYPKHSQQNDVRNKKKNMFGLFKKDPLKELQKEYKVKSQKAMEVQRSGDLRAYAVLVEELESIENKIAEHTK